MQKMTLSDRLQKEVSIAPLVTFRIVFGLAMLISAVRFLLLGWIDYQYTNSKFQFSYYGFEWVKLLSPSGMYALYGTMILSSIGIILGYRYRLSALLFFLSFTYVELIDKTYYLNHYYFVSIVSLLMIFLPAGKSFSLDVNRQPVSEIQKIPQWILIILKLQLGIVYFYAGLAKINYDWLIEAMPLKIWLPSHNDLPLLGWTFKYTFTAYIFSWFGMIYDLLIPFALIWHRIRIVAYVAVIIFHAITGALFPIGVFPVVMITATLIFFSEEFHLKLILFIKKLLAKRKENLAETTKKVYTPALAFKLFIGCYLIFQLLFPWRYLLYPGNLFWTEEGYRFSWRVMLMEKAGTATFYIKSPKTGNEWVVDNNNFLNMHQEKQMAMQPDMILQYAHFLHAYYQAKGLPDPEVRVEAQVTLNGRRSQLLIDPKVNLAVEEENMRHKKWITVYQE